MKMDYKISFAAARSRDRGFFQTRKWGGERPTYGHGVILSLACNVLHLSLRKFKARKQSIGN